MMRYSGPPPAGNNDEQGLLEACNGIVTTARFALAAIALIGAGYAYRAPIAQSIGRIPVVQTYRAEREALAKLDDVEMVPAYVDAGNWRAHARKELRSAGVAPSAMPEALAKLECITAQGNDGRRPWAESGEYRLPDPSGDGRFADLGVRR